MADYMDVSAMRPNDLWETDVVDLELGRAVQKAWRAGTEDARQVHEAEGSITKWATELSRGQAAC